MKKNEIVFNLILVKGRAPVNESENKLFILNFFLSEIERVEFYPTMCRMYQFRASTKITIEIARGYFLISPNRLLFAGSYLILRNPC